jgi:hypothetical protein
MTNVACCGYADYARRVRGLVIATRVFNQAYLQTSQVVVAKRRTLQALDRGCFSKAKTDRSDSPRALHFLSATTLHLFQIRIGKQWLSAETPLVHPHVID